MFLLNNFPIPFLSCVACQDDKPSFLSFPLCTYCLQSLIPAPKLCDQCGLPQNHDLSCPNPWISFKPIQSLYASYLLLSRGYRVLRRWKIHSGYFFDQKILCTSTLLKNKKFETWFNAVNPKQIIPIPQSLNRAWELKRSPALQIAEFISHYTQVPIFNLPINSIYKEKSQAKLKLIDRLETHSEVNYKLKTLNALILDRILLVDDFMTTGTTLKKFAHTLTQQKEIYISAFCLGVRPSKLSELAKQKQ